MYLFLFVYLFKCIHIHTYIHSFLCFGGPTRHYKTYGHAKVCVHVHTFFPWMETSHCENPAKEETMGTMNLRLWCCHAPIPRPPNKSRGSDRQRKVAVPHLKGPSRRPLIFPSSKSNYYDYTVTIFPQVFPYYHGWWYLRRIIFHHTFRTRCSETLPLIFHFLLKFPMPASLAMPWGQGWRQGRWWPQRVSMVVA